LNSRFSLIDDLQPRCFCAAIYFSSRNSTTEQRLRNVVNEQRATASSASDSVVADDEQEQTSARTVALPTTIVERFTVRIWLYYDDLVVIILSNSTLPL
jgi:predicted  nucleic acid-binding Zn-ribbon protein